MERVAPTIPVASEFKQIEFIPSGSHMADLVLGGGWARGRIANIIGGSSSGKTLLAVETCANFAQNIAGIGSIRYAEAESAFDEAYASVIGMPKGLVPFDGINTVEDLYDDLDAFVASVSGPKLYVLDSLDALTDAAEVDAAFDKPSYGGKAKLMSKLFRGLVRKVEKSDCTLQIISQVRDNVGVVYGAKEGRSGGKALDFYSSQIVWITKRKDITKTTLGAERVIGANVRIRTKKNKVGMAHREANLVMLFNYGIDDEASMLDWLKENKVETGDMDRELNKARKDRDRESVQAISAELKELTTTRWNEIEDRLRPTMRKYGE